MSRVVIAGAGSLARSLQTRLAADHDVSLAEGDLTALPEAEIALAGAEVLVVLVRGREGQARFARNTPRDYDALLGDSLARAARLCGVRHVVHFACGSDDPRLQALRDAGLTVSVLEGGGTEPTEALAKLVQSGPTSSPVKLEAWSGVAAEPKPPRHSTCSIQRHRRVKQWTALEHARAYFQWLPSDVPLCRTREEGGVFTVTVAGVQVLVLRYIQGRSQDHLCWLQVSDGALADGPSAGRFEFRVLLDERTVMSSLVGFQPSLPFPVYRWTQALLHERSMRRFGAWLETQA